MIIAMVLALLMTQIGSLNWQDTLIEKALSKSIADSQKLKDQYHFDIIKNAETNSKEEKVNRITLEELFGKDRYDYEMDDAIELNNQPVFVVRFFPKKSGGPEIKGPRQIKVRNEILNHLRGLIYINRDDFGILRVVTHANKSAETISTVGRLYKMDVTFEQIPLDGMWVPNSISVEAEYSWFLGWHHSYESTKFLFRNFQIKAP
jgi:hypothetical protein